MQGSTAGSFHGLSVHGLSPPSCKVPGNTRLTPNTAELRSLHLLRTKTGRHRAKSERTHPQGILPAQVGSLQPQDRPRPGCAAFSPLAAGEARRPGGHCDVGVASQASWAWAWGFRKRSPSGQSTHAPGLTERTWAAALPRTRMTPLRTKRHAREPQPCLLLGQPHQGPPQQ